LGAVLGIYLAISRGWIILLIGLFGIAAVYTYTGKPISLKYRGLGLVIIFLIFGPCALLGSYYVQMQALSFYAILISVPIGFLTTAILQANDLRDMQFDKFAGIKTLTLITGNKKGSLIYKNLIIMPYVLVALMIIAGYLPELSALVVLTLPLVYRNIKILDKSNEHYDLIVDLDKKTAQLQAQFGVLFVVTVLLSLIHL
jgi:1,4-dihydroxy-2-naphthoate octaprenyltransferase